MNRSRNHSKHGTWLGGLLLIALVAGSNGCSNPVDLSPTVPGGGGGAGGGGGGGEPQGRGPAPVDLGTAGTYVILSKEATTNVPTSDITGNIGLSPAAASFYSGFAQDLPAGGAFSTSPQVTGNLYASDYAVPTPANLTTAIGDMETAYTDAAGRPLPDHIELASGNLGGLTLPAGLYKWSNTVTIPGNVTLNGNANDVWIFQIAGGVTQASAARVVLTGGALAEHVFWQVAGVVAIGTTAHMEGVVMSATQITMNTGASANGRLLAQTAITLAGNTIVEH
jgi:ice-binding like protein